jgi:serine/threonine protein kinase
MAIVYRGVDTKLHREVAIKVLRPDLTATDNIVRAFQSEAAATSQLSHPNIVSLYDFGRLNDGRLYMVIELLHGRSLARILDDYHESGALMPWPRLVAIAMQVCAALSAAHAHGIIHHDITPSNIFCLSGRGIRGDYVKVLDFGLAKITEMTQAVTIASFEARGTGAELKGTPHYIAPEIIHSRPADHRIDIYGVGAVMYEMCSGRHPFNGANLFALLVNIGSADLIPPTSANPTCKLSPAAEAAVLAAMRRDPAGRPQTAEELACLLEATLGDSPAPDVSLRPTPVVPRPPDVGLDLTLLQVSAPSFVPTPPAVQHELVVPASPVRQEPVVAKQAEPAAGEADPRPVSRAPGGVVWRFMGLGLGIGGAVVLGLIAKDLLAVQPQPQQQPVEANAQSKPEPSKPPEPEPAKTPTEAKEESLEALRTAAIEARMAEKKSAWLDCRKKAKPRIMGGVGTKYSLPLRVVVAADGRASAEFRPSQDILQHPLLPKQGPRLCPRPRHRRPLSVGATRGHGRRRDCSRGVSHVDPARRRDASGRP